VALTGAGVSTASGIPDFRSAGGLWDRVDPMEVASIGAFRRDPGRVWEFYRARLDLMTRVTPNPAHEALARLQREGRLQALITQNVDGLHAAAGSRTVIDLHGRIDDVVCVGCHRRSPRSELQHRLSELNPGFVEGAGPAVEAAPDGDAELAATDGFRLAACTGCGGLLKPDVVFFGENVPRERVDRAYALVDAAAAGAGALLVAGSSLTVMSGLRFVRHAHRLGMPVVIVNRGATRGDELATLHVDAGCSEFLSALAAAPELRSS
jgi:NAD-dependent SIR2 family protein deacetylase